MPPKSNRLPDRDSSFQKYRGGVSRTSTTLIVRLKNNEKVAWDTFVFLYAPLIRHWCKKTDGDLTRDDRKDVTQEILIKAGKAVGGFDLEQEGRSFRAWLRRITQNAIKDYLDKKHTRLNVDRLMSDTGHFKGPYVQPTDPFADPDEEGEKIVILKRMLKVVKPTIKKEHWEVLDLLINAEKTSSEVAEIMDMKGDAVRQIRSRLIKRLREEYENYSIEGDAPGTIFPKEDP